MGVAHTFPPKNCSLLETDNVRRQISKHVFGSTDFLVYDRSIFWSFSKVVGDLRKFFWESSEIFVSDRKSSVAGPCIILYVMLIEPQLYYMKTVSAKDKWCLYYLTNRFTLFNCSKNWHINPVQRLTLYFKLECFAFCQKKLLDQGRAGVSDVIV